MLLRMDLILYPKPAGEKRAEQEIRKSLLPHNMDASERKSLIDRIPSGPV